MIKPSMWFWAQQRQSAWASVQSVQILLCALRKLSSLAIHCLTSAQQLLIRLDGSHGLADLSHHFAHGLMVGFVTMQLSCYAPNFEKVGGHIGFGLSVRMYVCMYVCIHVRDIVLKLHVWIPHGKIADAYFWFSLNYLPLSNYGPLTNKGMKFCKCRISKSIIARNLKLVSADRG